MDKSQIDFLMDAVRRHVKITPQEQSAILDDYRNKKKKADEKAAFDTFRMEVLSGVKKATGIIPTDRHEVFQQIDNLADLADPSFRAALVESLVEGVRHKGPFISTDLIVDFYPPLGCWNILVEAHSVRADAK